MGRREKIIVGLDIGSTKVCTLVGAVRDSGLEPIGFGVAESRGLKRGTIVNLEAIVECIKKSVSEAEAMAEITAGIQTELDNPSDTNPAQAIN